MICDAYVSSEFNNAVNAEIKEVNESKTVGAVSVLENTTNFRLLQHTSIKLKY